MAAFRGSYKHSIDHKGRVSIPARFRRLLSGDANETFVILRGLDTCVSLYPADEFKRLEDRLRSRSFSDHVFRRYQRQLLLESGGSPRDFIRVEFEDVDHLDYRALPEFTAALQRLRDRGASLWFVGLSPYVRALFHVAGQGPALGR